MSLLYKNKITYSVNLETISADKIKLSFSCNGGKFGTDEMVDEYELTVLELLKTLQNKNL